MPKVLLEVTEDEIIKLLLQLSPEMRQIVIKKLVEQSETWGLMKLSESAFRFWEDPAEDIYEL